MVSHDVMPVRVGSRWVGDETCTWGLHPSLEGRGQVAAAGENLGPVVMSPGILILSMVSRDVMLEEKLHTNKGGGINDDLDCKVSK